MRRTKRKLAAAVFAVAIATGIVGGCGGSPPANCAAGVRPMPFHSNSYADAHPGVIKRGDRSTRKDPGGARRGVACSAGQKFR